MLPLLARVNQCAMAMTDRTGASPSDSLVSYPGYPFFDVQHVSKPQQFYSKPYLYTYIYIYIYIYISK